MFEGQQLDRLPHDCDEWTGTVNIKELFDIITKKQSAKKLLPYLVLAVLLFLTFFAWQYYELAMMEREERRYNEYMDRTVVAITDRFHQYEMILRGAAGVFAASEEVTRDDWRVYYQYQMESGLVSDFRGMLYLKIVQPAELTQHVEEIRAEGFTDYRVWPEGDRNLYVPVLYKEPFDEDCIQGIIGYDMFVDPARRAVLEKTRDTGEVSLSGRLARIAKIDQGAQPGFLLALPVYSQSMLHSTTEERRAALEGYVVVTFRLSELMEAVFPDPIHKIDFHLYEGSTAIPEALLYDSHITTDDYNTGREPLFTSQQTLDLYNQQLILTFETMPAFEASVDRVSPKGILASGLLLSFLIFFYLRSLQTTGDHAKLLAREMTVTLRGSEEKFRYLAENITDVIWTADLEGNLTYISPAVEEQLGFTPEEVLAMAISDYVVKEDYDAMLALLSEELAKSSAERERSVTMQARYRTKDNRLVYVELNVSWILDEQGNITGVQGTTRDITERKQLEDQIIESRRMYQSVVDTQQEMVCRYLPDTTLTFVNDAYCRFYGKQRRNMLGRKFLDFTPHELHDQITELIKNLTPDNPSVMHEHYVFAADGSTRWQEWTERALFTETGEGKEYQGVGRNITERVLAEEGTLQAYDKTIEGWSNALELRDEETEGHSRRVTEMTLNIARMMNVKTDELVHIRRGALLHDIGKMGIPDAILLKPGKLTDEEWVVMRKHPVYAYEMIAPIEYLNPALDIPYCHHEKWDGSGYPRGLKGKAIPLAARIFAVVDVYDALTSDRPYRKAWSKEKTLALIKEDSGKHFDPDVVKVFLKEFDNKT